MEKHVARPAQDPQDPRDACGIGTDCPMWVCNCVNAAPERRLIRLAVPELPGAFAAGRLLGHQSGLVI
jgi:bacterioferritin-associated ferredoxin